MMKLILKTICLSLMFGNFIFAGSGQSEPAEQNSDEENFKAFKKCLRDPLSEDFFVIAITRNSKEPLDNPEIDILKNLLSELFRGIMSNKNNVVKSWCSDFSITTNADFSLEKLKDSSGLVAFNEYFFGKTPLSHDVAENYTKIFSEITPSYLFACNFLTYTQNFTPEQANNNIRMFYENKNEITSSILIENKTKDEIASDLATEHNFMLENKTFYSLRGEIVSIYNKSSYFDEDDVFLNDKNAFYYFGDCKDHLMGETPRITNDISTEICRDVSLGLRKNDTDVFLHLVQSNTLNDLSGYKQFGYLPPASYYIFCDPCVARNTAKHSHLYLNETTNVFTKCSSCCSCSFTIDKSNKYSVNIYKIE